MKEYQFIKAKMTKKLNIIVDFLGSLLIIAKQRKINFHQRENPSLHHAVKVGCVFYWKKIKNIIQKSIIWKIKENI